MSQGEDIKAVAARKISGLTLTRPWPRAITAGGCRLVARTWWHWSNKGHFVAIYAPEAFDLQDAETISEATGDLAYERPEASPVGIVAVARISGHAGDQRYVPRGAERWYELLRKPPYAWILADVVPIHIPVELSGGGGLWPIPGATLESVRAAWAEARNGLR